MSLKRKKRVLAIDDEPAMTEWLKILLEHAGYDVRTALIGTRGEELFKTWHPDAVVTDMMLPDVDGIELVRKFKQLDSEAEVIVIAICWVLSTTILINTENKFKDSPSWVSTRISKASS